MPSPVSPTGGERLQFADDLFLRRHRGLGSPVVNQFVWRRTTPVDRTRLDRFAAALAAGALARHARRPLLPGARWRWSTPATLPAAEVAAPVPEAALGCWLAQCADGIDPAAGVSHRVAAADLQAADGTPAGSVVVLSVSHSAADGAAMVEAVVRAACDLPPRPAPGVPALPQRVAGDLADIAGRAREIGAWARDRWGQRRTPAPATAPTPAPALARPLPEAWALPVVVAEVDAARVADVAAAYGGTTNSWFVAAAARLSHAVGRIPTDQAVPVALPVSARGADDPRANATRIARVRLAPEVLGGRDGLADLAAVRAACKAAYTELAATTPGAAPVPLALVQAMPDRLVGLLPQPPNAAVLASNLAALDEAFVDAVGGDVRSVAAIAQQPGATAEEVDAAGGGLALWSATAGGRTTLTVAGMDPARVESADELRAVVGEELGRWGLEPVWW